MGTLYLEIVTPERVVVSQEVNSVVAPGSEGEFGVLEGHVPFLTGIEPGALRYSGGSETVHLSVTKGFVEVSENKVSFLVDAAEKAEDIDVDRARKAMERARERLSRDRATVEDIDFSRAEAALGRAVARIRVAEKKGLI
jgi:F-type H+-transporting ATPase subunit epsilon